MKLNCWEFKACGREVGGQKAEELGICPAATERALHGIHKGLNGGRACWSIAGTLCGGEVQGTFAKKMMNCLHCDFLKRVNEEEGRDFVLVPMANIIKKDSGR